MAQNGHIEIAAGAGIGKDKNPVEITVLPGRVEPRSGVEHGGVAGRVEFFSEVVEALFESPSLIGSKRLICGMTFVAEDVLRRYAEFAQDDQLIQLWIHKTGLRDVDQFFVCDSQPSRESLGGLERRQRFGL